MLPRSVLLRLLIGLALLLSLLLAGFTLALNVLPTWGATSTEITQVLPGDELLPNAPVRWINAVSIDAPVEQVWPWIIQMGDTRGGYYSFSFIEQGLMRALNDPAIDPSKYYVNTNRVNPSWQNPPIGQGMILDYVNIAGYQPNQYLLAAADSAKMGGMGWTWLWHLTPTAGGRTRLVVHLRVQPPAEMPDNPLIGAAVNLSGVVMQRKMIQGIKLRAEGGSEPGWYEPLEIILWLGVLLIGLIAGWRYLTRPDGLLYLMAALDSVIVLFVLTYLQPALWIRALLMLLALAGLLLQRFVSLPGATPAPRNVDPLVHMQ